jgi:large subunit ribosomal protein L13
MKTYFPKKEFHSPKYFILDANGKTLGRLASQAGLLLMGKYTSFYTSSVDQGNFVIILNADKILVSGKKLYKKLYYRTSQRPGGLKSETFFQLKNRLPNEIIKKAIYGMLPKNRLSKNILKRLYIYSDKDLTGQNLSLISLLKAQLV